MYFSKTVKAREEEAKSAGSPLQGPVSKASAADSMRTQSRKTNRGSTPKVMQLPTNKIMIIAQNEEVETGTGAMAITMSWLEKRRQQQPFHIRLRLAEVLRDVLRAARGCWKLQRFVAALRCYRYVRGQTNPTFVLGRCKLQ